MTPFMKMMLEEGNRRQYQCQTRAFTGEALEFDNLARGHLNTCLSRIIQKPPGKARRDNWHPIVRSAQPTAKVFVSKQKASQPSSARGIFDSQAMSVYVAAASPAVQSNHFNRDGHSVPLDQFHSVRCSACDVARDCNSAPVWQDHDSSSLTTFGFPNLRSH
jgi:hypothetical protein